MLRSDIGILSNVKIIKRESQISFSHWTDETVLKTQLHLYSTDWRRGLALGLTQILDLASGNANFHSLDTNMLVFPTQNSGVGGIAQRQPPTPGILRSDGI